MNSPVRGRTDFDHSAYSPFTSPRQERKTVAVKSKEAEDRHGYIGSLGDPKKSSSSPELSSPPAVPKGNHCSSSAYVAGSCDVLMLFISVNPASDG